MVTFLGTAGKINENDINIKAVKGKSTSISEGYLWDKVRRKKAFEKAIR